MRKLLRQALFAGTLALGAPLLAQTASADTTQGISLGALAGIAIPSATGQSSRFGWGLQGDYALLPQASLGAYFLSSSQDTSVPAVGSSPAVSASNRISLYGVQGSWRMPSYPGVGLGARLGVSHNSVDIVNGGSTSDNSFSVGPYASYDYHFSPQFSFGGDASILFVTADQSYNVINLLATIKFWL